MKVIFLFLTMICLTGSIQANEYWFKTHDFFDYISSIQNNIVTNDSCKWLVDDAKWFYTPHAAFGPQDELVKIEVIGDTLIGDRVCSILGAYRQNEFLLGSELIVFYEEENEKVYLVKEEEFKPCLLYTSDAADE